MFWHAYPGTPCPRDSRADRSHRWTLTRTARTKPGRGSPGSTTSWPAAFRRGTSSCSREARHRQDHDRAAVPASKARQPASAVSTSPVGDRGGAARAAPRRTAGRSRADRDLRAGAAGEPARRRPAAEPALFRPTSSSARRRSGSSTAVERVKPYAGRPRQPVRDPPAGAELAALPPPDPGAQALFRAPRRDRAAARRPDRPKAHDKTVHSVAHGVIRLEELAPEYGAERRRLRVVKYRGQAFRGGYHDFMIETGGVRVFPRLVAAEHRTQRSPRRHASSGNAELDALLGGGIERGSSTLVLGPGRHRQVAPCPARSSPAAIAARREGGAVHLRRGARPAVRPDAGDGHRSRRHARRGDRFTSSRSTPPSCRRASSRTGSADRVEQRTRSKTVVIDSLNGYQAAMPEEQCARSCTCTSCCST